MINQQKAEKVTERKPAVSNLVRLRLSPMLCSHVTDQRPLLSNLNAVSILIFIVYLASAVWIMVSFYETTECEPVVIGGVLHVADNCSNTKQ